MMLRHFICISFYLTVVNPVLDYGEFDLVISDYVHCKGPKRRSCVNETITLIDNSSVRYNIVITEALQVVKGKISSATNGKELLRLQIKNVCENVFLKHILENLFHIQEQCVLPKGAYTFTVDIQAMARKFYGGKFMYGNWTSKVLFYTDYCNVHCGTIYISLTPKKSNDRLNKD